MRRIISAIQSSLKERSLDSLLVTPDQYREVIAQPMSVFHSTEFNALNRRLTPEIFHFLFRDKKYRAGLIAGIKDEWMTSPFSAPYGGFSLLNDVSPAAISEIIKGLSDFVKGKGLKGLRLTLPPIFYDPHSLSVICHGLLSEGFQITITDLNNQLELTQEKSINILFTGDGRRNLRIARENGLHVECTNKPEGLALAYEVIRQNREIRGFPLKMSLMQVKETLGVVRGDVFLCKTVDQVVTAAAIVFRVNSSIAQVIYWGHLEEFDKQRPMALLAYEVARFYRDKGFSYLDIGPSTEQGKINEGLYRFKQSIGCTASLKFTFEQSF